MKSEEIILQELERDRQTHERSEASPDNQERANIKFMISGEAPVLMSKACELLIKDLSFRAWQHTERNRRRTLQKQDLHAAVGESEVYDFLIDIVPRVQTTQAPAPQAPVPPTMTTMNAPDNMSMMQVAMPSTFQVPQMSHMAANLNYTTMQQTAQAMAASVPVGAPPAAIQQTPVPASIGLDPNTNTAPPAPCLVQFQHQPMSTPIDALHHLVQWDPSQLTFQPGPAPEGTDMTTANPVPIGAPAPATTQQHEQHQHPPQQHHQQDLQQPLQHQQQHVQQTIQQPLQQPNQLQQPHQHQHLLLQQAPAAAQHQHQLQPSQQQQHLQMQHTANHHQWMDQATMAALGAPSAQQAPGV
jgi:Histone-like transcription factor (CBF/NF-Y) and archaeal histone